MKKTVEWLLVGVAFSLAACCLYWMGVQREKQATCDNAGLFQKRMEPAKYADKESEFFVVEGHVFCDDSGAWSLIDKNSGKLYQLGYNFKQGPGKIYTHYFKAKMKLWVLPGIITSGSGASIADVIEVITLLKVPYKD